MRKILPIIILAFMCNLSFSQTDTTAIFHIADSLKKLGDKFSDEKKYTEALELYNQMAEMTKEVNDGVNEYYIKALCNVGNSYFFLKDYQKALDNFLLSAEYYKKYKVDDDPLYASKLNDIGVMYFYIGDYPNALMYYTQALEMRRKTLGEDDKDILLSYNNIALAYSRMEDYQNALKFNLKSFEGTKMIYGEGTKKCVTLENDIGAVYMKMGDYYNAMKYFIKALETWEKYIGEENITYIRLIENVGRIYSRVANYQESLKYYMHALDVVERNVGEEHVRYASSMNDIGIVYYNMGEYEKSLKSLNRAMEIRIKLEGEVNQSHAKSLNNIGLVYQDMGDYQNSLKSYFQSLEIMKKTVGEESPEYAALLDNIGNAYNFMGKYEDALNYHFQALKIRKNTIGEEHPEYANSLGNIGIVYLNIGDYQNSLKYHTMAAEIYRNTFGDNNPNYALSMKNIGVSYQRLGEYPKALEYYLRALEIQEKTLGKAHYEYAMSMCGIARTYYCLGEYHNAILANKQASDILKSSLIKNFSFMTTHERETYWNLQYDKFYININNVYDMPDDTLATKTSYDTELLTKGLLLASEISMTNIIMESGNNDLISEYENMKNTHQLHNMELEKPIAERIYNCDSLENEIQKMERHIMESCKEFGDITNFIKIDWKDVQNSMKENDVAIEFSDFSSHDTTRFVALVLTKEMEAPACVPLFTNFEMQKLIRGIVPVKSNAITGDENRGVTTVTAKRQGIYESMGLYELLWKPLEKFFPENPRIFFAPSGMLHQIAVEYAPISQGQTISDKYEIYRVSSTRFLAMDYMPAPMNNIVLYGGVYYDSDTTTMKRESSRYATRSTTFASFNSTHDDYDRGSLTYLPGTKTEVDNIVGKMKKSRIKTKLYSGAKANEESFKALSGSDISVLHIATHGFFLPTEEKMSGDQSLVQSGLLLSGANYAWQNQPVPEGVEDGILTAKEISFMDLRKTDLVVLSACQTALGEISGEGVFGLQRGFKKAGVRTIIMSLWPVDDNATLLMMTEFYTNLTKGMSKREAFLSAQNKVKTTAGFENPRFWAAFIMLDGNN